MEQEVVFSDRLRRLRSDFGISQQRAADGIGMTKVGYQNYEYGRQMPNFVIIPKLANFFRVSTDYLLGLTDDPRRMTKEDWALLDAVKATAEKQEAKND